MKEYKYKINGNEYSVAIIDLEGDKAAVEVNGVSYQVDILTEGYTAQQLSLPQLPHQLLLQHPPLLHPLLSLSHPLLLLPNPQLPQVRVRLSSLLCPVSSSTSRSL